MPNVTYSEILPRQTLANAVETFQRFQIPNNGTIHGLIYKLDGLVQGATDTTDQALTDKIELTRIYGGGKVKSEIDNADLVRIDERVFNQQQLHVIGTDADEGIAATSVMHLNPMVDGSGNYTFESGYGAGPGQITQIDVVTRANQTDTDTCFLTIIAVLNVGDTATKPWLQYKRKTRTAVAGAVEIDPIYDVDRIMGFAAFMTTGVKDASAAIPAALSIRGVTLQIGSTAVSMQVPSDATLRGGVHWMTGANATTLVNVANYDFIWIDTGIKSGGSPAPTNAAWRVEEGAADATRRYTIGLAL